MIRQLVRKYITVLVQEILYILLLRGDSGAGLVGVIFVGIDPSQVSLSSTSQGMSGLTFWNKKTLNRRSTIFWARDFGNKWLIMYLHFFSLEIDIRIIARKPGHSQDCIILGQRKDCKRLVITKIFEDYLEIFYLLQSMLPYTLARAFFNAGQL